MNVVTSSSRIKVSQQMPRIVMEMKIVFFFELFDQYNSSVYNISINDVNVFVTGKLREVCEQNGAQ